VVRKARVSKVNRKVWVAMVSRVARVLRVARVVWVASLAKMASVVSGVKDARSGEAENRTDVMKCPCSL